MMFDNQDRKISINIKKVKVLVQKTDQTLDDMNCIYIAKDENKNCRMSKTKNKITQK